MSKRSAIPPPRTEPELLVVGEFVGPHGIRGDVKLKPITEFPERLPARQTLIARSPTGKERVLAVRSLRPHGNLWLGRFEGVATREEAEALRHSLALIEAADAAPLSEGRFYEHQILGLRVLTPEGEEVGRVERILETPANDVYVAGDLMIPATHDAVARLDPAEGVLVLSSLAYVRGEEAR